MTFLPLLKFACLMTMVCLLFACGETSECHDCTGGFGPMPTPDDSRLVDVSGEVDISTVKSYFSLYEYGPTQKFYHFTNNQTVLTVRIDNAANDFNANVKISVNTFKKSESVESINKWINNQHSDGIYGDAPEPIGTLLLPADKFSIVSSALMDHTVEESGNEYDNYMLEIYVDDYIKENVAGENIRILNFTTETNVHVITKDGYALDTTADGVIETEILTYPTLLKAYGPTLKFYYFPGTQRVLVIRINNTSANFVVSVEVKRFGASATKELVGGWINNQYAEGPMDAAEPTDTFVFPEDSFSINPSGVLEHIVGEFGDEYDHYKVEINSHLIEMYQWYSVLDFIYEADVYVMTKDMD